MAGTEDDDGRYAVVVNDEEQYSIWPADREPPAGWRGEGTAGTRQECADHIDRVWTDMRPLSLRRAHAEEVPG
ncbi:MAG TPA: MbtH family NRPS accessory protein [Rugosimonospora sp.]|nr:MbtH family NRPS accessory protein [Rugosimonospora sp.]